LSLHFPNFLRFSRDFTRISKSAFLLKIRFCTEVLGTFQSLTQIPFFCTQALGKIPILIHMPSRCRVGSPRGDWRGWSAQWWLRRGRVAADGGGGRGGLRLRRGRGNAGQRAMTKASTGPRGVRTVGTCRGNTEERFTGGWPWGVWWTAGAAVAGMRRKCGRP
jgi:hypothetical protein